MKETQTAIYLNHDELAKIQWALNNLHMSLNSGEININEHTIDTVVSIINKVKEAKEEILAKEYTGRDNFAQVVKEYSDMVISSYA